MIKKILLFSSTLFLISCAIDEENNESTEDQNVDETIELEETDNNDGLEEIEDNNTEDNQEEIQGIQLLTNLMNDDTFVDSYALQAWTDYQEIVSNVSYGEAEMLIEEGTDFAGLEGSSVEEVQDVSSQISIREDAFTENVEINEMEEMQFIRYPAEENSEFSEISDFLAELSFYYLEDNLIFSSITPGYYAVDLNSLPDATSLTMFLTVDEIEAINPQVFTIAEMKVNEKMIRQVMIPAIHINEEGDEEIVAFYFFTNEEDILYYASLPFEMVMQSFPDYSVMIYQELLPVLIDLSI